MRCGQVTAAASYRRALYTRSLPFQRESTVKLFHSTTSPYVRQCLVAAHELGLVDRIQLVPANASPINRDRAVVARNPLGKVPTMIDEDGVSLHDSRVIIRDSYGYVPRERYIERRTYRDYDDGPRGGIGFRAPGVSVGVGVDNDRW